MTGIDAERGTVELGSGRLNADVVVAAPGPGAVALLPMLDVAVPLAPHLEQVVHFGSPCTPDRYDEVPCLFEDAYGDSPGFYAMPTPGVGYKIGLDTPVRDWTTDDLDRTPSAERTRATARAAERLGFIHNSVLDLSLVIRLVPEISAADRVE